MKLTRNERLRKLGNAIRAYRGTYYCAPQKSAKARVLRWAARCEEAGDVSWMENKLTVR